jgi:hypothetical protein
MRKLPESHVYYYGLTQCDIGSLDLCLFQESPVHNCSFFLQSVILSTPFLRSTFETLKLEVLPIKDGKDACALTSYIS